MQNRLLLGFKLILNPKARHTITYFMKTKFTQNLAGVCNDVIKDVKTMLAQHKTLAPISYA